MLRVTDLCEKKGRTHLSEAVAEPKKKSTCNEHLNKISLVVACVELDHLLP
jgi:hypothetical protein